MKAQILLRLNLLQSRQPTMLLILLNLLGRNLARRNCWPCSPNASIDWILDSGSTRSYIEITRITKKERTPKDKESRHSSCSDHRQAAKSPESSSHRKRDSSVKRESDKPSDAWFNRKKSGHYSYNCHDLSPKERESRRTKRDQRYKDRKAMVAVTSRSRRFWSVVVWFWLLIWWGPLPTDQARFWLFF